MQMVHRLTEGRFANTEIVLRFLWCRVDDALTGRHFAEIWRDHCAG